MCVCALCIHTVPGSMYIRSMYYVYIMCEKESVCVHVNTVLGSEYVRHVHMYDDVT